jgi:hypothetical protein
MLVAGDNSNKNAITTDFNQPTVATIVATSIQTDRQLIADQVDYKPSSENSGVSQARTQANAQTGTTIPGPE